MCPVCMASAALTATSAGSAGVLSALILKIFRLKIRAKKCAVPIKGDGNGNEQSWIRIKQDGPPTRCVKGGMACGSQGVANARKGAHACERRVKREASRTPVGKDRKAVFLRYTRREENARRSLRRPQPVNRLPLHVRPRVGGGLPGLFDDGGHLQRQCAPVGP